MQIQFLNITAHWLQVQVGPRTWWSTQLHQHSIFATIQLICGHMPQVSLLHDDWPLRVREKPWHGINTPHLSLMTMCQTAELGECQVWFSGNVPDRYSMQLTLRLRFAHSLNHAPSRNLIPFSLKSTWTTTFEGFWFWNDQNSVSRTCSSESNYYWGELDSGIQYEGTQVSTMKKVSFMNM